ncbi:unnamed protein product, partial [Cladocopium goreaui]
MPAELTLWRWLGAGRRKLSGASGAPENVESDTDDTYDVRAETSEACRAGRSGLQLVGAVPMYLKIHSEGEFCEEADFIEASMKHNMSHYPRLFVGIPFTPHRGRRFITAAWLSAEERAEVQRELMQGVRAISVRANVGVNVGFPTEDEGQVLTQQGFIARTARQAWWSNRRPKPYKDFRDFLRTLRLKRAREIAKQRAALRDANVQTMVIDGSLDPDAVTPELMSEVFHSCYVPTQLKNGNVETSNGEYRFDLTEDFFCSLGERIPHRVLLILARENDGRLLGGSLCFVKDGCIYGRYWGSAETELDLPFLHFECCYYSAIEHAIAHGYERIEPGNGGGQVYKVQRRRGFEPVPTCSFHFIPDLALREEVAELARCAAEGQSASASALAQEKPRDDSTFRVVSGCAELVPVSLDGVFSVRTEALLTRIFGREPSVFRCPVNGGERAVHVRLGTGRQGKTLLVRGKSEQKNLFVAKESHEKDPIAIADLRKEFDYLKCLQHPNISKVVELVLGKELENGQWTDRRYVISELA